MFCSRCRYCLAHTPGTRCPECGRRFDPDDPVTYLHGPRDTKPSTSAAVLLLVGAPLALLLALMTLAFVVLTGLLLLDAVATADPAGVGPLPAALAGLAAGR